MTGEELTAKDFRTWAGTVLAACALCGTVEGSSATARKRFVSQAIGEVAERLGNTKAVCRRCYVHPAVIDAFLEGETIEASPALVDKPNRRGHRLSRTESALVRLLQRRLPGEATRPPRGLRRWGRTGVGSGVPTQDVEPGPSPCRPCERPQT